MSEIALRHIRASSVFANVWSWDNAKKELAIVVNMSATAPFVSTRITLCCQKPLLGAFSVRRLDESTFRVMPAKCVLINGLYNTRTMQYHELLPLSPISLTSAPAEVANQIGAL